MFNMYSLYIPKYENEGGEFLITKVIREYTERAPKLNCILSSPGYLSNRINTINLFVDKMCGLVLHRSPLSIGLFNGMNGNNSLGKTTIVEYHNMCFREYGINALTINCKKQKDHRKMMFFIDDPGNYSQEIKMLNNNSGDKTDFIDWYINSIKVKGILIGSSNQSHNTYFSYDASKGEADLLMFTDSIFAKHMINLINLSSNYPNDNFYGCVLSESIAGCIDDGEDYLNSILKDFLLNNIL